MCANILIPRLPSACHNNLIVVMLDEWHFIGVQLLDQVAVKTHYEQMIVCNELLPRYSFIIDSCALCLRS